MTRGWHLVAYDIRDDHRLRRVAKLMEGYGDRVQLSIFRCRLSPRTRAELLWKLSQITEDEDSVMVLPLCDACVGRITQRGAGLKWVPKPVDYAVY